jgi:hypothetical protein
MLALFRPLCAQKKLEKQAKISKFSKSDDEMRFKDGFVFFATPLESIPKVPSPWADSIGEKRELEPINIEDESDGMTNSLSILMCWFF